MIYRLLTIILWPVFFVYSVKIAKRYSSSRYLWQRLGWAYPKFDTKTIWIHCVSVGEVNAFAPLFELMLEKYPDQQFVISTNTPTGASIVEKNKFINTTHCYFPYDSSGAVKRFLSAVNPKILLIMETEIWPQLYKKCHDQNIPISIINGRLSHKTLDANAWIKKQYKQALQYVDSILVRSVQDRENYIALGASKNIVSIIGNMKYSASKTLDIKTLENFTNRAYVLAASTHEDEEYQLAKLWTSINNQRQLLVIAPRHPQRLDEILQKLNTLDLNIAVRSRSDAITENTDVYLADTLGELTSFMAKASLVFMAGSLIPHGGQNLLEPARLSKAIVTGPYIHNFQNEVDQLKAEHACVQVQSIHELGAVIENLLVDSNARTGMEACAKQFMDQHSHVASDYLTVLQEKYQGYL